MEAPTRLRSVASAPLVFHARHVVPLDPREFEELDVVQALTSQRTDRPRACSMGHADRISQLSGPVRM